MVTNYSGTKDELVKYLKGVFTEYSEFSSFIGISSESVDDKLDWIEEVQPNGMLIDTVKIPKINLGATELHDISLDAVSHVAKFSISVCNYESVYDLLENIGYKKEDIKNLNADKFYDITDEFRDELMDKDIYLRYSNSDKLDGSDCIINTYAISTENRRTSEILDVVNKVQLTNIKLRSIIAKGYDKYKREILGIKPNLKDYNFNSITDVEAKGFYYKLEKGSKYNIKYLGIKPGIIEGNDIDKVLDYILEENNLSKPSNIYKLYKSTNFATLEIDDKKDEIKLIHNNLVSRNQDFMATISNRTFEISGDMYDIKNNLGLIKTKEQKENLEKVYKEFQEYLVGYIGDGKGVNFNANGVRAYNGVKVTYVSIEIPLDKILLINFEKLLYEWAKYIEETYKLLVTQNTVNNVNNEYEDGEIIKTIMGDKIMGNANIKQLTNDIRSIYIKSGVGTEKVSDFIGLLSKYAGKSNYIPYNKTIYGDKVHINTNINFGGGYLLSISISGIELSNNIYTRKVNKLYTKSNKNLGDNLDKLEKRFKENLVKVLDGSSSNGEISFTDDSQEAYIKGELGFEYTIVNIPLEKVDKLKSILKLWEDYNTEAKEELKNYNVSKGDYEKLTVYEKLTEVDRYTWLGRVKEISQITGKNIYDNVKMYDGYFYGINDKDEILSVDMYNIIDGLNAVLNIYYSVSGDVKYKYIFNIGYYDELILNNELIEKEVAKRYSDLKEYINSKEGYTLTYLSDANTYNGVPIVENLLEISHDIYQGEIFLGILKEIQSYNGYIKGLYENGGKSILNKEHKNIKVEEVLKELINYTNVNNSYSSDIYKLVKELTISKTIVENFKYTLENNYISEITLEGFKSARYIRYNNVNKLHINYTTGDVVVEIEDVSYEGIITQMKAYGVSDELISSIDKDKIKGIKDEYSGYLKGKVSIDFNNKGFIGILKIDGNIINDGLKNILANLIIRTDNLLVDIISAIDKVSEGFLGYINSIGKVYINYRENTASIDKYVKDYSKLDVDIDFHSFRGGNVDLSKFEYLELLKKLISRSPKDTSNGYKKIYKYIENIPYASYMLINNFGELIADEISESGLQLYIVIDYKRGRVKFIESLVVCEANEDILYKSDKASKVFQETESNFIKSIQETKGLGTVRFYGDTGNDNYFWYTLEIPVDSYNERIIKEIAKKWSNYNNTIEWLLSNLDKNGFTDEDVNKAIKKLNIYNKLQDGHVEQELKIYGKYIKVIR